MAKISEAFPSKWLKAEDLSEQGQVFTIVSEEMGLVGEDIKPILTFAETTKQFGCNKTNGKIIAAALGLDDTADWVGRKIVMFATQCDFQGEQVDCIRVKRKATEALQKTPQAQPKQAVRQPATPTSTRRAVPAMTQAEVDDDDAITDANIPF